MLKLFELFMANPLHSVVATLCAVTLTLHLGLANIEVAMAVVEEQQVVNKSVNEKVFQMNNTLIRIDENLKIVKANQDKHYVLLNNNMEK
jgi:hypothetical protein